MKGKKPQMLWYNYCFLISSDGPNVSFIIEQLQSIAMEYSFWAEVILTVFTGLHNYYGLMENADSENHTRLLCFAILLTLLNFII